MNPTRDTVQKLDNNSRNEINARFSSHAAVIIKLQVADFGYQVTE